MPIGRIAFSRTRLLGAALAAFGLATGGVLARRALASDHQESLLFTKGDGDKVLP